MASDKPYERRDVPTLPRLAVASRNLLQVRGKAMTSLATAIGGMKHWDWCPICRGGLDTGLECDQCGADLMPIYKALKESLSGGNPGEPKACTPAEERGIVGATGAGQLPDGNPESTGDSADRRSPGGTERTPSPDESNRHFDRGCFVIMELMQAYERDALKAENERLREALVTVRTSLHCTKRAPFEYDADHHCSECGWSSAYAKDVIDESLLGRHAENSLSDPQGMTPAVRELARYADHTFSCAMAERGYFDEDGNPVDCTCGYTQAIESVLKDQP